MLRLKVVLQKAELRQVLLATHLGVSTGTISQLINHGLWPRSMKREELEPKIRAFLVENGIPELQINRAFEDMTQLEMEQLVLDAMTGKQKEKAPAGGNQQGRTRPKASPEKESTSEQGEETMLLRKQSLTPAAKRHFGIFADPFGEVRSSKEVFTSPDIRYIREALFHTAKHGGFMAVWGESGSGKSTLRKDLEERIESEGAQVQLIQPYIVGMEDNDMKGKTLRATHVAEAIMDAIAPLVKLHKSPEKRFRQVHEALRDSARTGYSHCLVIEEAHSIPIPVLKHLKRFYELEDGFKKLISIILIGQPELAVKLDERNPQVREVVQRCELVQLQPLGEHLKPYLEARFKQIGKGITDVMDDEAVDALRAKLSGPARRPGQPGHSVLYPLAVGNVLTAAMNAAAEYSAARVTADLVMEV